MLHIIAKSFTQMTLEYHICDDKESTIRLSRFCIFTTAIFSLHGGIHVVFVL